jgi:hypothetical protein
MVDGSLDFLRERLRIAEQKHHYGGRAQPRALWRETGSQTAVDRPVAGGHNGVKSDPALGPCARRPNSCEPDELNRIKPI